MNRACVESPHSVQTIPWSRPLPGPSGVTNFNRRELRKKNLDNDSLNGPEVTETQTPIFEHATGTNWTLIELLEKRGEKTQWKNQSRRRKAYQRKKKFNDMRRAEADKKLRSF